MPTNYNRIARNVPVTTQADPRQVPNDSAGFVFQADILTRLERFLILGAEGSTYYISHQEHALRNVQTVTQALAQEPIKAIDLALDVSVKGRAMKQDAGLYLIAEALKHPTIEVRQHAAHVALQMTRTGSTLLSLIAYIGKERGTGKIVRGLINEWYNSRTAREVAYQVLKYANRATWTHGDVIRRGHPKPSTPDHDAIFKWLLHNTEKNGAYALEGEIADYLRGYDALRIGDERTVLGLVERFGFTHDMIPSERLTANVWRLLLEKGLAMTALTRNLGSLTAKGLLDEHAVLMGVVEAFRQERITKGRVHPMTLYQALKVYASGKGVRGSLTWNPKRQVIDALDRAFYLAFGNLTQSNKRIHVALDHSGSMTTGNVLGMPSTTPAQASVAMGAVLAHQYPYATFTLFGTTINRTEAISPNRRLDDIERSIRRVGEATDFSVAMNYHAKHDLGEALIMFTDGQVNTGQHVHTSIAELHRKRGAVKVVGAFTESNWTSLTIDDPLYLGIVGFDSSVPQLLTGFLGE
jgi:60 kDa SS-A/Ro ribonucleoprotein